MIKIVRGDLLQAKENLIGHQVNCIGAMNSGLAKSVREAHPHVFTQYRELVTKHNGVEDLRKDLLGKVQAIKFAENQWIANIFGQYTYGRDKTIQYTDTEALFTAFKILRQNAESRELSVALPYMIGCYRGGADWKEVEDLLLTAFDGYEVTLYKLHRG